MGTDPRLPGLTTDREPGRAVAAARTADDGPSRRAFLTTLALGGAAVTVGAQLVPATRLFPVAGAQEGDEVTLDADETQIQFLASISLAANEAYRAALARPEVPLPEPTAEVVRAIGSHHNRQAVALAGRLPDAITVDAIPANATFLTEQTAAIDGATSTDETLAALRALEETVAATQLAAMGAIESQDDARLVATLLPVSAQHASVLGSLAGDTPADVLPPLQDDSGAIDPSTHPGDDATTEG